MTLNRVISEEPEERRGERLLPTKEPAGLLGACRISGLSCLSQNRVGFSPRRRWLLNRVTTTVKPTSYTSVSGTSVHYKSVTTWVAHQWPELIEVALEFLVQFFVGVVSDAGRVSRPSGVSAVRLLRQRLGWLLSWLIECCPSDWFMFLLLLSSSSSSFSSSIIIADQLQHIPITVRFWGARQCSGGGQSWTTILAHQWPELIEVAGSEVTCRGGNLKSVCVCVLGGGGGGGEGEILMDGKGTIPDLEGLNDVGTGQ